MLHGSCTLHWHRARFVRATPICIRPIFSSFFLPHKRLSQAYFPSFTKVLKLIEKKVVKQIRIFTKKRKKRSNKKVLKTFAHTPEIMVFHPPSDILTSEMIRENNILCLLGHRQQRKDTMMIVPR